VLPEILSDEVLRLSSAQIMIRHPDKPFEQVELIPAGREDELVLANLLELYIHDFSEFYDGEIGANGRFGYGSLPLYWSEPDRHPFLMRTNGKLAGLVFVMKEPSISGDGQPVWDMAEFFILRRYRRRRIGTAVAHEVWKNLPGRWEVRVMESNAPAQYFWSHAISTFIGEAVNPLHVDRDGKCWKLFSFEARSIA
jgi:predicted acetyltransferase